MNNYIIPVETFSKKLILYFFGEVGGYTDIVIMNEITGKLVLRVRDAKKHLKKDKFFPFKTITISGLEPGRYEVFAITSDSLERSYSVKCIVTGDSKKTMLNTAMRFANVSNDNMDLLVADISDNTPVQKWLFTKYLEEEDEDNKKAISSTLLAYISILNTRIKNVDLTNPNFEISPFDGSFKFDYNAVHVIRFDMIRGGAEQFAPDMVTNKQSVSMRDDSLYLYVEVDDDGLPMSQQIVFVPDEDTRNRLAIEEIERIQRYNVAIEKTIEYPASYLDFTEQEQEYLSLIDRLLPATAWVTAPTLKHAYGYISAEIHSEDKALFSIIGENLYLAFSEPELCLEKGNERVVPLPRSTRFFMDNIGMIDEDYFYWVQDKNGKIISDIKLFNQDTYVAEDFNNRIRRLYLSKYQDHLIPYITVKHPTVLQKISDAVQSCVEESYVSIANLHVAVLEYLCSIQNMKTFPEIIMGIKEDHILYGDYYTQFFTKPIRYKYKQDTIELPPGKNIIYRIDAYRFGSRNTYFIAAKTNSTIEHRFYNEEYVIVSAINVKDMKMSGFVLLDFSSSNIRADVRQFLVDTAEIIY